MIGRIFKKIKLCISKPVRLLLFVTISSAGVFAQTESNEYNVKAMFVLNFMKYIEWPAESHGGTFRIGVAGDIEIYRAIVKLTNSRQDKKKIKIEYIDTDAAENFQIVIIARNENKRSEEWAKKYQGKGVLLISDECKNTSNAAINLLNINNKIRFEINSSQAKLGGVKISSRLADLAVTVHP